MHARMHAQWAYVNCTFAGEGYLEFWLLVCSCMRHHTSKIAEPANPCGIEPVNRLPEALKTRPFGNKTGASGKGPLSKQRAIMRHEVHSQRSNAKSKMKQRIQRTKDMHPWHVDFVPASFLTLQTLYRPRLMY